MCTNPPPIFVHKKWVESSEKAGYFVCKYIFNFL